MKKKIVSLLFSSPPPLFRITEMNSMQSVRIIDTHQKTTHSCFLLFLALLHPTPEGIYGGNYITFRNAFKNNNHTAPASPPSIYSKSPERQLRNDDRSMKTCPVLAFTNTEERIRKLGMGRLAVSS